VALIVSLLFINGLPGISWNFLTGGIERGSFFLGATRVALTLERDPTVSTPAGSGAAPTPLLAFQVAAEPGSVVDSRLVAFEKTEARSSVVATAAAGAAAPPTVAATDRQATISSAGQRASLDWNLPIGRETGGGLWTASLDATNVPDAVDRLDLQFLVQAPLTLPRLAEAVRARADGPEALARLRAADAAALFAAPLPGWRLAPDRTVEITRIAGSGLFPMIYGTFLVTLIMTILCVPFGVLSALYLHEYARRDALHTRIIRTAISNLAGVPSIVFGLFGLGFFIATIGPAIDRVFFGGERVYAQPCVLWASCTLAVLTLPVVIVATEEALRAIPRGLRDASLALGGTRWQTVWRVVVPEALPGILTGMILAVGRGAGEVAPILFTGVATSSPNLPSLWGNEKFMHLGNHVYVLATQSPDVERTRALLYATVVVLLALTFLLNLAAILLRMKLDSGGHRGGH
jgi:phosphate transport system permease protein